MMDEQLVTMKTREEIIQDCRAEVLRLTKKKSEILREASRRMSQIDIKIEQLRKIKEAHEEDKPFAHFLKEPEY